MQSLVEISVIVPIYNDRESLELFFQRLIKVLSKITDKFELIFIDDGSVDNSISTLKKLKLTENRLKIIRFYRNFGIHSALSAGFKYAKGKMIVTIDSDLQTDPEELPLLLQKINEGNDIVSGWRDCRKDPLFSRRLPSFILNLILSLLIGKRINDICCTFKIFKKEVVQDIIYFGNLLAFTPLLKRYNYAEVKISHYPRLFGKSKFNYRSLIKQAYTMLIYTIKSKFHIMDVIQPSYRIEEIYE